jgi:hypothetical protein
MDTPTRTWTRRIAVVVLVVAAGVGLDAWQAVPARPALVLHGADAVQERTVDWAMRRFRAGGLEGLPPLDVVLHGSRTACDGYLGLYLAGRIDLCTEGMLEPYARKYALHEMAHAWTEANLRDEVLVRFLRTRGIAIWNDQRLPWKERGAEQAAEIITWGLGEGEIAPLLPDTTDVSTLVRLYELLTSREPITPAAWPTPQRAAGLGHSAARSTP